MKNKIHLELGKRFGNPDKLDIFTMEEKNFGVYIDLVSG